MNFVRAFSKLIDMQSVGLDTQQYYFFLGGGQNIKSHQQRVRVVTPLLCNFHSTSFSSAGSMEQKIVPLLAFFCLRVSAAGECQPIRSRYESCGPIRGQYGRLACPGPRVGNTLECLDRDNQFLPHQAMTHLRFERLP